ncbi:phosphogluconate dehydrogenase (plasmid) [Pacificitalea manganoxidans]|uniref:Phosphogluconate dehydrogenase n=1 Tax=Pacificitalea manganoxidans TaxID=1411902 RepID=A0A291M4G0_9RHOB|nr:DUF1932 domain-containing protein [Pacificitalea manganoxidans]ATI43856.1 phosphogluconate dehydrogenase [Pacificitalea manganoxidans]MDR6310245.1 3-hydroxyisobutyrate dehydrogenase-like beta-hydroxyacid dehydrogenase [Pacificitalea manganoxidans]
MNIAFIGFGEAGRSFADSLQAGGAHSIAAFDRRQDDEMAEAMRSRNVRAARDPSDAVSGADWIIAAVTADESLNAAQSVAPALEQGQIYFDINSVSPGRKRDSAELIEGRNARYIDMAVMAPVHPRGHATPILLGGTGAEELAPALTSAGFKLEVVGDAPGDATAIKMVRSLFVKGLEAITVEAMLAARASGAFEKVLASLSNSYPGLGWPDIVGYNFERTLRHGKRRAAEMRESAATLDALGLNGGLAAEIARVQDAMGHLPLDDMPEGDTADAIAQVLKARHDAQ